MAVYYRSQAFILSKDDLREADQIFNIYTEDFGKLKVLARAIRKIKSKLRSGIDLFYLSEIEFIQGRNFKTLTGAVLIEKFKNIRNDLGKLEIAYKIVELTDILIKGQEQDKVIFNLLNETFNRLNDREISTAKCELFYYYFLWNFLSILGFQIDLYNCVICQKKLVSENLYFGFIENGTICRECSKFDNERLENISPEVIKILRIISQKNWEIFLRLKIPDIYKKELENISENYLLYIKENQR